MPTCPPGPPHPPALLSPGSPSSSHTDFASSSNTPGCLAALRQHSLCLECFLQLPRISLNIKDPKKLYLTPQSNDTHLSPGLLSSSLLPPPSLPTHYNSVCWFVGPPVYYVPFVVWLFSHSVVSDSFIVHGLQDARLPCPSRSPQVCSNPWPLSCWCHLSISSSVPFLILHGARQITEAQLTFGEEKNQWMNRANSSTSSPSC